MSRKARQLTNNFSTGAFAVGTVDGPLRSPAVGDVTAAVPKVFAWANANVWCDLESGRNVLNYATMILSIRKNGRYTLTGTVNLLASQAVIVHKFDAFNIANDFLFTIVTPRQSIATKRYTATITLAELKGTTSELKDLADLNEVSYFVRRGAGEYRG